MTGEVQTSGAVAFSNNMTMLKAIAQRGGFTDFADKKKVYLVRGQSRTEHDLRSAGTKSDAVLRPGDMIVIRGRSGPFGGRR